MPANVSEKARPIVIAGLAKLVEEVKKYAAPMYAPTAGAARCERPVRTSAKITSTRPAVATTSARRCGQSARSFVLHAIAGAPNIMFARIAPPMHPTICAGMYAAVIATPLRCRSASTIETDRVEVGAGDGLEDQDEHGQAEGGGERVLEELQPGIGWGEGLRGDAGADDDGSQQGAAEKLAREGASGVRAHDATRSCETRSRAPGTSLK